MQLVKNIVLSGIDDDRFNRQLQLFSQGKLTAPYLSLGSIGPVLKKIGIRGHEIRLSRYVLEKKLTAHKELSIDLLKDLPSKLNRPVFAFYYSPDVVNIITEAITYNQKENKYGLLLVGLLKSDKYVYVYLITTLHGRPLNHLINWIHQDK